MAFNSGEQQKGSVVSYLYSSDSMIDRRSPFAIRRFHFAAAGRTPVNLNVQALRPIL